MEDQTGGEASGATVEAILNEMPQLSLNDLNEIFDDQDIPSDQSQSGASTTDGSAQSGTPSSTANPENRILIQRRLVLLLHAKNCMIRERHPKNSKWRHTLPHCIAMRRVIDHMITCEDGKECTIPHCSSSRQIITHSRMCQRSYCPVCSPLKGSDLNRVYGALGRVTILNPRDFHPPRKMTPENLRHWEEVVATNQPVTMAGQTEAAAAAARIQQLVSYIQFVINTIQVFGYSTQYGSCPDPMKARPVQDTKEWHQSVTLGHRNYLLHMFLNMRFPPHDLVDTFTGTLRNFAVYAQKVEEDMYKMANSRSEYYHLIAENLYKIEKESRELQKIKEQQMEPNPSPSDMRRVYDVLGMQIPTTTPGMTPGQGGGITGPAGTMMAGVRLAQPQQQPPDQTISNQEVVAHARKVVEDMNKMANSRSEVAEAPRATVQATPSEIKQLSLNVLNEVFGGHDMSSSTADPENRILIQRHLVLLLHAKECLIRECRPKNKVWKHTLPHCIEMKRVITHMRTCEDGKECTIPHCSSSRQIITHWRTCQRSYCPVCSLLKGSDLHRVYGPFGHVRIAEPYLLHQPLMMTSNGRHWEQVVTTNQPGAAAYIQQLVSYMEFFSNIHQVFGYFALYEHSLSNVPGGLPVQDTKEWHQSVPPGLRRHLLYMLYKTEYSERDPLNFPCRITDNHRTCAEKIEEDMYKMANSRSEYYHLIAETIYKMEKEAEEKFQKIKEQQSNPSLFDIDMLVRQMRYTLLTTTSDELGMQFSTITPGIIPGQGVGITGLADTMTASVRLAQPQQQPSDQTISNQEVVASNVSFSMSLDSTTVPSAATNQPVTTAGQIGTAAPVANIQESVRSMRYSLAFHYQTILQQLWKFQLPGSLEPDQVTATPVQGTKEWHRFGTLRVRNPCVRMLVQAIFPASDSQATFDKRVDNTVAYARKVEEDIYKMANSRLEYYHLIVENMYTIRKELEEKRQKEEQMAQQQQQPNAQNASKTVDMSANVPPAPWAVPPHFSSHSPDMGQLNQLSTQTANINIPSIPQAPLPFNSMQQPQSNQDNNQQFTNLAVLFTKKVHKIATGHLAPSFFQLTLGVVTLLCLMISVIFLIISII